MSGHQNVLVAMDWTDFDHEGQSTLVLSLVTGHGRAAPLLWLTVWKDEIATRRNDYEDACLRRLAELVPPGCKVTILADRGFGDQKLFACLGDLGFGYLIRFRGNIRVTAEGGETWPATEWVATGGKVRKLRNARVTAKGQQVGAVVCVHAKGMKDEVAPPNRGNFNVSVGLIFGIAMDYGALIVSLERRAVEHAFRE